ncbi:exodeoxyribonuclease VII small subunit [Castellaniella hirudinis]|uniref:exodeoxyribonuclease VII small subunit n=1 Tax=Castellaniella hirudinis TaxID=1144617 RepID=UPI0039C31693
MTSKATAQPKNFRQAYDVLQRHASTLRDQTEPNIDDLLDIVNESVAAYKVCKQRIDAVEKALAEALDTADIPDPARQDAAARDVPRQDGDALDSDALDDDPPF